jgi:hypothetical protein
MKKLIAAALIVCATIVLVAVAFVRHVNNKQDALWCHERGYANYATKDGFCVGAGGKLIKWVSRSCAGRHPDRGLIKRLSYCALATLTNSSLNHLC